MNKLSSVQDRLAQFSQNRTSGYVVLLGLTLLMFGDVLLPGQMAVLGNRSTDVFGQFLAWRQFGFGELAQGNIALWNPHVFAGAPYFGGFQSALLYPPNWLFLVLPIPLAINWSIALHVFLVGAFMNMWALRRGLHPVAACLSGVLLMFCGAYFLHIYAGHLTNLSAMVWVPLVFLSIDELFECAEKDKVPLVSVAGWCLFGSMAVNLQVLAGHPQYVFYTAVAAGIYVVLCLVGIKRKSVVLMCLAAIAAGGIFLSAVQLVAGMSAASETVRSKGLTFELASMFSLPPENLLTLFAPGLFGSLAPSQYFGRGYLWEMSAYLGVTACILAVYGSVFGSTSTKRGRHRQMAVAMILLFLISLGANTPIFHFLYSFIPGFDRFRGIAKFIFPASVFAAMLAGIGFDRLLRTRRAEGWLVAATFIAGCVLLGLSLAASQVNWLPVLEYTAKSGEAYLMARLHEPSAAQQLAAVVPVAQGVAAKSLLVAGCVAILLAGLMLAMRRKPSVVWLVGVLALLELVSFAAASRDTFNINDFHAQSVKDFVDQHPGDYRIVNTLNSNSAMIDGSSDLAGSDPGVVRRYAEFMAFAQGENPDRASQYLNFHGSNRLYDMLRLRFVFQSAGQGKIAVTESPHPMPQAVLIGDYRHIEGRDAIFAAMKDASFDFRREVILEKPPNPLPSPNPQGLARVIAQTTDFMTVEVETSRPAILLMTDVYTPSWQAFSLEGSVQQAYELVPANYVLRAIPLDAGHHRILVKYQPKGLLASMWISILSLLAWIGAATWLRMKGRQLHRDQKAVPL